MAAKLTEEDDELLDALGVEVEVKREATHTSREERIIAGFEEIQRFVEKHGHAPRHGEGLDIFERLYAVRLDRIREQGECRALVEPLDHQRLLSGAAPIVQPGVAEDADAFLLEQLGVGGEGEDLTELRHVRSAAERREAEEIAKREKCEDFDRFKPLFEQVRRELASGVRQTRAFQTMAEIKQGEFFIVGGQVAYVAEVGEEFTTEYERRDSRLRVIYDNGTESDVLLRSLQRALHRDEAGRRITDPVAGPLFADEPEDDDLASGTIYVLRSKSDHPVVAANRDLVHKIGVTNMKVEQRIAGARMQPTYLMADVEIVAEYQLFNINRTRLENLIHRVFEPAKLDIQIMDRFGNPCVPREWFLVPRFVIDEVVEKIKDGTITEFRYDPAAAALRATEGGAHSVSTDGRRP